MDTVQTPTTNPEHSINWRKHTSGCKLYRERWFPPDRHAGGELLYQVFCAQGTPPTTHTEQQRCMCSNRLCWRTGKRPISSAEEIQTAAKAS